MIDDVFVIDAVVHAYNLDLANAQGEIGRGVRDAFYGLHSHWNDPRFVVPKEQFQTDQSIELLTRTLFLESRTDLACYHSLRLDSLFADGLCSHDKNIEAQQRWPQRYLSYAGIDPTDGVAPSIESLEAQVESLPGKVVGMKFYPDQINPYRTYRMDDPAVCFPLYQRAEELGIKTVAVHKALPNGPVPLAPYKIDDVEGAAMAFPKLNFEIVHGGMAFVEETAYALARFENVYVNLEITTLLLFKAPRLFQEAMGAFLFWGGPQKILWSSGMFFAHPEPMLEAFWDWQLDDITMERFNLPQITKEDKALILGQNYARMNGIDIPARQAGILGDEFDVERRANGLRPPFSVWKEMRGVEW